MHIFVLFVNRNFVLYYKHKLVFIYYTTTIGGSSLSTVELCFLNCCKIETIESTATTRLAIETVHVLTLVNLTEYLSAC